MDLYEELVLKRINSILEDCKDDKSDDKDEDDDDKDEDDDDKDEDEDDDDKDEDDDEDLEESYELEESYDFEKIKVGSKFIKPSSSQVEALEALFGDVSQKEREDLWKDLTKDDASFRRIVKYAETIL